MIEKRSVKISTPMMTISSPADDFDDLVVPADLLEGGEEAVERQRRREEGNAQAERVDREQHPAVAHRAFPAASARIDPRIGPMHGVQPKAKARPTTKAPSRPTGLRVSSRASFRGS